MVALILELFEISMPVGRKLFRLSLAMALPENKPVDALYTPITDLDMGPHFTYFEEGEWACDGFISLYLK